MENEDETKYQGDGMYPFAVNLPRSWLRRLVELKKKGDYASIAEGIRMSVFLNIIHEKNGGQG
jgi:hypothetical protein